MISNAKLSCLTSVVAGNCEYAHGGVHLHYLQRTVKADRMGLRRELILTLVECQPECLIITVVAGRRLALAAFDQFAGRMRSASPILSEDRA